MGRVPQLRNGRALLNPGNANAAAQQGNSARKTDALERRLALNEELAAEDRDAQDAGTAPAGAPAVPQDAGGLLSTSVFPSAVAMIAKIDDLVGYLRQNPQAIEPELREPLFAILDDEAARLKYFSEYLQEE